MGFQSVRFYQFRNVENLALSFKGREVFLVGENGQGKTNVLEGLYCLSYGGSFRVKKEESLIQAGKQEALVEGVYQAVGEGNSSHIRVHLREGEKQIRLDGRELKDRSELVGRVPSVLFVPQDTQYLVGPPETRRHFFNQTAVLANPLFYPTWRRYARLLRQRNAALKQGSLDVLDVYDEEFVRIGLQIMEERRKVAEAFDPVFSSLFEEVSRAGVPVGIRYLPSWTSGEVGATLTFLRQKRGKDLSFGTTTTGPHRDRFLFLFGGKEFAANASNGQVRLASLVLKIAQALYFSTLTQRNPILLVDDVLLEMDYPRRKRFLEALPTYDQAFFTFLPDEPFRTYQTPRTQVYTVRQGVLEEAGHEG